MVFASLQISFSSSGTNGVIFTNSRLISSPAHGVSVSQKPIFCMLLSPPGIRRTRIFYLKKPKFGVLNALPDGGIEAHSTSSQLLEKEFKFSPTFDEYVKVLESVKTDRSRLSSEEGDAHGLKKKSVRRDASKTGSVREKKKLSISKELLSKEKFSAEEKVRDTKYARGNASYQRHGGAEKSSTTAWTMVEGILEKKAKEKRDPQQRGGFEHRKSDGYLYGGRNVVHKKIKGDGKVDDDMTLEKKRMSQRKHGEPRENRKGFKSLDDLDSSKFARGEMGHMAYGNSNHSISFGSGGSYEVNMFSKSERPNSAKIVRKTESFSKWDKMNTQDYYRRSKMKNLEFERNQSDHEGVLYPSTKEISDKDRSRRSATLHGGSIEAEKPNSRGLATLRRSGRTAVGYTDVSEGDIGGLDLEDRAAFRTFEEFADVRNRPRVLRMELEERIQGLAKWLNASNLNMPEWQFSKMIHSAKIKFSEHSILRIVQILGSLGNWRQVLQVIEWFHSRERFKYYKSKYIYTTALDVLGKAKRPVEALNIFNAMRQELSSYPDLATYHCIAVTLGQAGLMKELFDVIECMRAAPGKKFDLGPLQKWDPRLEPDLVVYNAVLNACVQQKQCEGAFWVLQELKKQGMRPSNTTYGLIMEVMLACGKYNLVHEFFRKSQKNSIPGALNYKVLINTLWKEGKVEEAVQAVKDMERRGIVGSASLYYDLARCLCSAGRCLEALQQVNKISKVAKKPLVVTYTGLIQACLDTENIENASYIFSQMKNFCSPNVITCNIMLKSYVKHGMFEEAIDLFQSILAGSHEINSKAELSQKVLPDKFTFNTMIEACAAASKWDDFENSYGEMLHHGYHFDEKRHMRLIFDAWRAGKKHILEVTWDHLVSNGRIPPPAIIKELFCKKMEDDEPASAISFITIHDMEIDSFSQKSWLNLLRIKAHSIRGKTINRLSNELKSIISESGQSHPVYQNLLKACKEFASSLDEPILLCNSETKSY